MFIRNCSEGKIGYHAYCETFLYWSGRLPIWNTNFCLKCKFSGQEFRQKRSRDIKRKLIFASSPLDSSHCMTLFPTTHLTKISLHLSSTVRISKRPSLLISASRNILIARRFILPTTLITIPFYSNFWICLWQKFFVLRLDFLWLDLTLSTINNKIKIARVHHSKFSGDGKRHLFKWP